MGSDHRLAWESLLGDKRLSRLDEVLAHRTRELTVVVENLYDAHNVAAVFRNCDAFGVQEMHVVDGGGDFQVSRRLTQGCHKWLDGDVHPDPDAVAAALKHRGYRLLAATLTDGAVPLPDLDLAGRVAFVFGNEMTGLTPRMEAVCDGSFVIPMRGFSQSFNISVSVAITLQHAFSSRTWPGLAPEDRAAVRDRWLQRAAKQSPRIAEALDDPLPEVPWPW